MKEFSELDKELMSAVQRAMMDLALKGSPEANEQVIELIYKSMLATYPNGFKREYPVVGQEQDKGLT